MQINIPNFLFYGKYKELTTNARLIYSALVQESKGKGNVICSKGMLAIRLCVTPRTVRNQVKELTKIGLIREEKRGWNEPTKIYINRVV